MEKILDVEKCEAFKESPKNVQDLLRVSLRNYQDHVSLQLWLAHYGLDKYYHRLKEKQIVTLSDLARVSDDRLQQLTAADYTLTDYTTLTQGVADLSTNIPQFDTLKNLKPRSGFLRHIGTIIGLSLFTLLVGMLVVAVNMNYVGYVAASAAQRRLSQGSSAGGKHSILEFVTGKYLAIQYCKVVWDWGEPTVVGKTVSFRVKFFQRSGRPYAVSSRDNLLVEIMLGSAKVPPTVTLPGGADGGDSNVAQVSFTVHRAGEYRVAVLVGAKHIRGSPFVKRFLPGPLDPSRTGFVNQTSIVVAGRGARHTLQLEPRDEFGNLCNYDPETDNSRHYCVSVTETVSSVATSPPLSVRYEAVSRRISLDLRLDAAGCYSATATYRGHPLRQGEFTLIVLDEKDTSAVNKNIAKKSHNIYYEARLLTQNCDRSPERYPTPHRTPPDKAKKVFCYISPKQLTIKEFALKIFPIRLFTFRVCPSTKFQFLGVNNQHNAPVLVIDDGSQAPVKIAAKDRNIIAATFTSFLLKNIGGSETFADKQDFFYQELRLHHAKRPHDKLTLRVSRDSVIDDSLKATKNFSVSEWCKNFEIVFQGEEGLDWGGLRREWFELVCTQLFDPDTGLGLFHRFNDDAQALVHPVPSWRRPSRLGPGRRLYEFAGRVVGKALYESALGGAYRQMVKARFSRSFLAQLIGLRVTYKYFEQDDPDLYVSKIRYIEQNSVAGMDLVFAEEEYGENGTLEKVVELVPGGSHLAVTDENKLYYLDLLAGHRLAGSVRDEVSAFLRGLHTLVPDNLLSIFDDNELELLMCGTGTYSITEFKEHHSVCGGATPEFNRVLSWFWAIVAGFTREEWARLLQFTTGCSQLPPGGFAQLTPKVQLAAAPTLHGGLPTAHTCFNQLCLPEYDSMEQMHRMLVLAINEGSQGFSML